eukprot:TRINITY_DN6012_c0_g1_i5.p1 TRINITY_DN6012_c0_g1~~TRINITY_DN6012_c0_g1_i5.p1  ORF type:complete len:118 (-),score=22.37 TRINITY_DN6012_c0_g1_i5:127-480(-)
MVLSAEVGDKAFTGGKTHVTSDRNVFLITGGIHNFKSILLKADEDKRIKLRSKKFGVAQDITGMSGQRVYTVKIYEADGKGYISLNLENGEYKVYFSLRTMKKENWSQLGWRPMMRR